jgi:antitoxin MazE
MRLKIIKIGNSKGVRLPAALIDQCGFEVEVEAKVEGGTIILAPASHPRAGWEEAFAKAAPRFEAEELIDVSNQFDLLDW